MIETAAIEKPEWATAQIQLDTLLDDLGIDAGSRDREILDAFDAALGALGGSRGSLGRQLVPAVIRTPIPLYGSVISMPLPPVIEVKGFERQDASGLWMEDPTVSSSLDADQLTWSSRGGGALRVVAHHGYLDADVPPTLKVALRLMVRQLIDGHNEKRQTSIDWLLDGLQVYG